MSQTTASNMTVGIVANLLVQGTGFIIPPLSFFNQVATCTATNAAIQLPAAPILAQAYKIRNDGVANCLIFPPTGGIINSLAANTQFTLAPHASVEFICASVTAAPASQWYSFNYLGPRPSLAIVGATTLTPELSGSTFGVDKTAAYAITLPDPALNPGLRFSFISGPVHANAVTIGAGAGNIMGFWQQVNGTATLNGGANTTIGFTATSVLGDRIDVESVSVKDGANPTVSVWRVNAVTQVAAGIAFA